MKLLLISPTNNVRNGYGNATHELCMYLYSQKIDFTLLLPKSEKRYDYTVYKAEYILPEYIFSARTWRVFQYVTFRYKTDADIVHSIFEYPYDLVATSIARKSKKPMVITAAGTYAVKPLLYFPDKYFAEWAYNSAKLITAISAFTAQAIKDHSKTKTPIKVMHVGVNFKRFDVNVPTKDIINKFGNKKILLTVGGLKPRKGQDVVIKALAEVIKKRDDFHYVIVGADEKRNTYTDELKSLISTSGLQNYISFAGSVSDDELVRYFHAAYAYIHTPRMVHWNFEGFGIVYLEAGACKKPVIASDSGGTRDAVLDGKTGIVVPENEIQATATAIEKLLDNPNLAKNMGEAGFEYAKERDWSHIAPQYLAMYNELLGS